MRTKLRSKLMLLFMSLAMVVAVPAVALADQFLADADTFAVEALGQPTSNVHNATQQPGTTQTYPFSAAVKQQGSPTTRVFANVGDTVTVTNTFSGDWLDAAGSSPASFLITAYEQNHRGDISIKVPCDAVADTQKTMRIVVNPTASNTKPLEGDPQTITYNIKAGNSPAASCAAPANTAPVANNDIYNTSEDTPLSVPAPGVLGNDTDADSNPLTAALGTGPSNGELTLNSNGSFTYTPNNNFHGSDSFTYRANDGTANSNTATVTINVAAVNDPPVISSVTNNGPINEGSSATITVNATDVDNPASELRYNFDCDNNGTFEKGPNAANSDSCSFDDDGNPRVNVQVTDGAGGSAMGFTNVQVNNVAPTVTNISASAQNVLSGKNVTFTGTATDPSTADTRAGFLWKWDVGQGFVAGANPFTTTFANCGSHSVKAIAGDKDGGESDAVSSPSVNVYNASYNTPLNEGMQNLVQAGRVIPVKISAGCASNLTGLTPSIQMLKGLQNGGESLEGTDNVETLSSSAADTTGVMRPVDGGYIYNLQVPSTAKANDLYTVRVNPFGGNNASSNMYVVLKIRK